MSGVPAGPLVTVWPDEPQVQRTVSPAWMVTVLGEKMSISTPDTGPTVIGIVGVICVPVGVAVCVSVGVGVGVEVDVLVVVGVLVCGEFLSTTGRK